MYYAGNGRVSTVPFYANRRPAAAAAAVNERYNNERRPRSINRFIARDTLDHIAKFVSTRTLKIKRARAFTSAHSRGPLANGRDSDVRNGNPTVDQLEIVPWSAIVVFGLHSPRSGAFRSPDKRVTTVVTEKKNSVPVILTVGLAY